MSVNEDWDVEQHKVEYESDEHWELRRKFLLAHKDKFSEDVLVCLAQVFVNIELLGCRYPQETMDLVKELSEDIAADYREKQKKKLQRTFVEASQAASSKVKGCTAKTSTVTNRSVTNKSTSIMSNVSNINNLTNQSHDNHHVKKGKKSITQKPSTLFINGEKESVPNVTSSELCNNPDIKERLSKNLQSEDDDDLIKNKFKYGNLILWEREGDTMFNTLVYSVTLCGCKLKWKYAKRQNGEWRCSLFLDSEELSYSINTTKIAAKDETIAVACEKLRKRCYTVKVKYDSARKFNLEEEMKRQDSVSNKCEHNLMNSVPNNEWRGSNCIGEKLMKLMGWTGGGLGKSEQGVVEPMSSIVARSMGLKMHWYCDYANGNRRLIASRRVNVWNFTRKLDDFGGISKEYELVKPVEVKNPFHFSYKNYVNIIN
ncbi:NF-kappa-B-repressing factor isoform X2 [Cardiocondyla obscurior]|uniref:NF-kappa-B-repressing factor isoform X2 n=1 Tax=Cardiocondyla obscurior TaxID=286306 RepID=UPI00396585F2